MPIVEGQLQVTAGDQGVTLVELDEARRVPANGDLGAGNERVVLATDVQAQRRITDDGAVRIDAHRREAAGL